MNTDDTPAEQDFSNQLLVALPALKGDFFVDSVTLLADHGAQGAFGLVINKALDVTLQDLFPEYTLQHCNCPVLEGGPVEQERLFFIHDAATRYEATHLVSDEIALTTSLDIVSALAEGTAPDRVMALLGYAGWGEGQLESELLDDVWLLCPASHTIVFDTPVEQRSTRAAAQMGIDLNLLVSPGHG